MTGKECLSQLTQATPKHNALTHSHTHTRTHTNTHSHLFLELVEVVGDGETELELKDIRYQTHRCSHQT